MEELKKGVNDSFKLGEKGRITTCNKCQTSYVFREGTEGYLSVEGFQCSKCFSEKE